MQDSLKKKDQELAEIKAQLNDATKAQISFLSQMSGPVVKSTRCS